MYLQMLLALLLLVKWVVGYTFTDVLEPESFSVISRFQVPFILFPVVQNVFENCSIETNSLFVRCNENGSDCTEPILPFRPIAGACYRMQNTLGEYGVAYNRDQVVNTAVCPVYIPSGQVQGCSSTPAIMARTMVCTSVSTFKYILRLSKHHQSPGEWTTRLASGKWSGSTRVSHSRIIPALADEKEKKCKSIEVPLSVHGLIARNEAMHQIVYEKAAGYDTITYGKLLNHVSGLYTNSGDASTYSSVISTNSRPILTWLPDTEDQNSTQFHWGDDTSRGAYAIACVPSDVLLHGSVRIPLVLETSNSLDVTYKCDQMIGS